MRVPEPCGIQDHGHAEGERPPTCTLPAGHGDHEEIRDGQVWAQWRGGRVPSHLAESILRKLIAVVGSPYLDTRANVTDEEQAYLVALGDELRGGTE